MRKYPVGSAAIGVIQMIDAGILYSNNGVCEGISLALAGVEFLWAVVSLVMLFRVKHKLTRLLALAFFVYNAFGWLASIFMFEPSASLVVPIWFVFFGGAFGFAYAVSSVYVAKQP